MAICFYMLEPKYEIKTYSENDPQNRLRGKALTEVVELLYSTFNDPYKKQFKRKEILEWIFGNTDRKSIYQPIENSSVFVIEDVVNKKIAGVIVTVDHRGVKYIPFLAVSPEYRRKGLATRLMKLVKEIQRDDLELRAHHRAFIKPFFEKTGFDSEKTEINFSKKPKEPIYRAILKKPK